MKHSKDSGLDFIVDKLTNSIENTISGDSFQTEVSFLTAIDIKAISKNKDWDFDWKLELKTLYAKYIN